MALNWRPSSCPGGLVDDHVDQAQCQHCPPSEVPHVGLTGGAKCASAAVPGRGWIANPAPASGPEVEHQCGRGSKPSFLHSTTTRILPWPLKASAPPLSSPCLRTSCPSNASLATCAALPPTKSTLMSSTQASTEAFGCRAANGPMNDRGYHKFGHQQSGWAAC